MQFSKTFTALGNYDRIDEIAKSINLEINLFLSDDKRVIKMSSSLSVIPRAQHSSTPAQVVYFVTIVYCEPPAQPPAPSRPKPTDVDEFLASIGKTASVFPPPPKRQEPTNSQPMIDVPGFMGAAGVNDENEKPPNDPPFSPQSEFSDFFVPSDAMESPMFGEGSNKFEDVLAGRQDTNPADNLAAPPQTICDICDVCDVRGAACQFCIVTK